MEGRLDREFRRAAKHAQVGVKRRKGGAEGNGGSDQDKTFRPLKKRETLPLETLKKEFPGIRHVKVSKSKGGTLAQVSPLDGPARKVQLKKASEAVVIWVEKGEPTGNLRLSVRWPAIFRKFGVDRFVPRIPDEATVLATWKRHELIWLDDEIGNKPGFYRVKEFDDAQVTVLPENAVTDELAKRLHLQAEKKRTAKLPESAACGGGEELAKPGLETAAAPPTARGKEVKLGKRALAAYFQSLGDSH